ncbi:MAG: baeRF10 domain-containing protein [Chloroflexota bacterium]
MTATRTTTKLGPDQAHLKDLMRDLAEATSTEAPVLSVYIDVRPAGERPGERNELTVVRDRLNAIGDALEPHTDARESFDADRARIDDLLQSLDLAGTDGVAVFACGRIGLWEAIGSNIQFDTQVSAGPTAELFQMARMLDENVSAVVAVVDTSTCRLFVTRRGDLLEREGRDEGPEEHTRHDQGAWSQARYQRHIDMQDRRFAAEAALAIDRLVQREHATHVLLAGDEHATSVLVGELSERVRPLVEHVAHLQMRSSPDEVREEIAPLLSALEEAEGQAVADRAIGSSRAGDLGVTGIDATMAALEAGQVDELVIDDSAPIEEELRAELVRQASLTDARVEIVHEHEGLLRFEGVGATLRFRV